MVNNISSHADRLGITTATAGGEWAFLELGVVVVVDVGVVSGLSLSLYRSTVRARESGTG